MTALATRQYPPLIYKTGILLVDDHPMIRHGLAVIINEQSDMEVCGEVPGIVEAMKFLWAHHPDIVIVDLSLKNGSGFELVGDIARCQSHTKVIVFSAHEESIYAERVLRLGAKAYINKMEAPYRIVEAVRCLQTGKIYLSETMKEQMLCRSVGWQTSRTRDSSVESFTDRELDVFESIGKGLSVREIAEKLHLSPKTIETYRDRIKAKLHLNNSRQVMHHAIQWVLQNH